MKSNSTLIGTLCVVGLFAVIVFVANKDQYLASTSSGEREKNITAGAVLAIEPSSSPEPSKSPDLNTDRYPQPIIYLSNDEYQDNSITVCPVNHEDCSNEISESNTYNYFRYVADNPMEYQVTWSKNTVYSSKFANTYGLTSCLKKGILTKYFGYDDRLYGKEILSCKGPKARDPMTTILSSHQLRPERYVGGYVGSDSSVRKATADSAGLAYSMTEKTMTKLYMKNAGYNKKFIVTFDVGEARGAELVKSPEKGETTFDPTLIMPGEPFRYCGKISIQGKKAGSDCQVTLELTTSAEGVDITPTHETGTPLYSYLDPTIVKFIEKKKN